MRILPLGIVALFCTAPIFALHESDVGVVDWYKPLLGVPLTGPKLAPIFHRVGNKSTKSVILTATNSNILGALDPVDGTIAWRHVYEADDTIVQYEKNGDVVASLSGPGGVSLRLFDVLTGSLLLEKRLHSHLEGNPDAPTAIKFVGPNGIIVLTNGYAVNYIDFASGTTKWTWLAQDQSSSVMYTDVVVTPEAVYVIGLVNAFQSYSLHSVALSLVSGEHLADFHMQSSLTTDSLRIFVLKDAHEVPTLMWLQKEKMMTLKLSPSLLGQPVVVPNRTFQKIVSVGLEDHGFLVAINGDGSSCVLDVETRNIFDFVGSTSSGSNMEPLFSGGFDKASKPYVARLHWSSVLKMASVEIYAPHLSDNKGLVTGFPFPFDTISHGIISSLAIDTANPSPFTVLGRLVLTTSTGSVQLWQQDKLQWVREESLASSSVTTFVELPEQVASELDGRDVEIETLFIRLNRQIHNARDFPEYLVNFVKRFATGSYESISMAPATTGDLVRDSFGFRQIIITASSWGKIIAIDSSNGEIVWSRILGYDAMSAEVKVIPVKIFVMRAVGDGNSVFPQVAIIAQMRSNNGIVGTVVYHFNALTGKNIVVPEADDKTLHGLEVISGPLTDVFMLNHLFKPLVLLDESLQVRLYPDNEESRTAFAECLPSLHIPLIRNKAAQLVGHQLAFDDSLTSYAYPTWSLSVPHGETIYRIMPATQGPVVSFGKVLGNRTTIYKYLNPRMVVLITQSPNESCGIYVVDGAKGTVIYRTTVSAMKGRKCDVQAVLSENRLVYHYYEEDISVVGHAKGFRMVVVEFYEGKGVDDKTRSSDMSTYSFDNFDITSYEQSYVFATGITAIATTSTKFGISTKDIIVSTPGHKVYSIPGRLLNPRRPNRKPTNEEMEEGLVQYNPIMPYDPKRVLSHRYDVAGTLNIITAPALLESTSLVLAQGLDLFLTRVAPSNTFDVLNENFNKVQLVFTILGLAIAILVTKPMVGRKRLREKWYQ